MPTVLVVEDNEPIRDLCAITLKGAGYRLLSASTAEAGLDLFRSDDESPDVLVADLRLPGIDGHALWRRLVRRNPELKVLFISGYENGLRHDTFDADVAFLKKPFLPSDLTRAVASLLAA